MFVYCNNNPVNLYDEDGKMPDSIAGWIGEQIGKWLYEVYSTDEDKRDTKGNLTINAKLKRTGNAVLNNAEVTMGIGMGLRYEKTLFEVVGIGAGMYVTNFSLKYSDGSWTTGQNAYSGVSATFTWVEVGAADYGFKSYGGEWENESWSIINDKQRRTTIYSDAVFAGIGGCVEIAFDFINFFPEFKAIWWG
jgi:hypothetical protein